MTRLHAATNGPLVREIVDAVLLEISSCHEYEASQSAAVWLTKYEAAKWAIEGVREHLAEHLCIPLAVVLASHGVPS